MNWTALIVFIALFLFVVWLGFAAAHWRRGDLDLLYEWGLGGRRFGTVVTWFLLGGDLYTAYTFIAIPALMYGAGAVGFFAVPYSIMIFPMLYAMLPRMWEIYRRRGYVTAADFVRGRFGNRWLALAVALTGLVATMPYIALQLVGMEVVIGAMGVPTSGLLGDLPLVLAFAVLAAFTYTSGLRAPAMIAVVKDLLIYVVALAAVIAVPLHLGGFAAMFARVPAAKLLLPTPGPGTAGSFSAYATLALGSALALYLYPHSLTGILSASDEKTLKRNAIILPAYSILLGVLCLMGFMALALGVGQNPAFAEGFRLYGANFSVPALFLAVFPSWFLGVAFAAIAIGALVPAAIMSIAAANIFTRNVYREFIHPNCSPAEESRMAKLVSLIVKIGALVFVIFLPTPYAVQLQLLGGVWIIQTLPSVILPLYTRFLSGPALLVGWVAGVGSGTWMAAQLGFTAAIYPLTIAGFTFPCYIALSSLAVNIAVSALLSPAMKASFPDQHRATAEEDFA